jgi:hypothetical protein
LGKIKLWQALSAVKELDPHGPLHGLDFDALIARAGAQHDELEAHRLALAKTALTARDTKP